MSCRRVSLSFSSSIKLTSRFNLCYFCTQRVGSRLYLGQDNERTRGWSDDEVLPPPNRKGRNPARPLRTLDLPQIKIPSKQGHPPHLLRSLQQLGINSIVLHLLPSRVCTLPSSTSSTTLSFYYEPHHTHPVFFKRFSFFVSSISLDLYLIELSRSCRDQTDAFFVDSRSASPLPSNKSANSNPSSSFLPTWERTTDTNPTRCSAIR